MRNRGFLSAGLMVTLAGLYSPAFAAPPVEQLSGDESGVIDPSDYGPRGSASVYGGTRAVTPYSHSAPVTSAPVGKPASGQWELYSQMQQLQEEVQSLRGMVEQQTYEIEQLKKQLRDRYLDMDSRLSRLQSASGSVTGAPVAGETSPTVGPGGVAGADGAAPPPGKLLSPSDATADEKAAYDAAQESVRAKKYDLAISQLEALLVKYPNGALAPNCHYWLGDLYASKNSPEIDKAQGHFQLLLKKFPSHAKVPDALFKMGKIHKDRGDKAKAKAFFERVVASYPQSSAAAKAREQLR
jgi:tol-pal system protein YbgF